MNATLSNSRDALSAKFGSTLPALLSCQCSTYTPMPFLAEWPTPHEVAQKALSGALSKLNPLFAALLSQHFGDVVVSGPVCKRQGRFAVLISGIDIRAVSDHQLGELPVVHVHR
jgi:hypothetical protein